MKPTWVVAILAVLAGLLAGYLVWGARSRQLQSELATVKAHLAEADRATGQQGALATRLQEVEAYLKAATESLTREQEARAQLEKLAAERTPTKK